jgi:hypothetical protein
VNGKSKICRLYGKVSRVLVSRSYEKGKEGWDFKWANYARATVPLFIRPVYHTQNLLKFFSKKNNNKMTVI